MTPRFSVRSTPRFERLVRNLLKAHQELRAIRDKVGEILETDPYNLTRRYNIKKLAAIPLGEGRWRLALGRFRYDIAGATVELVYCGLRREDTYD
jgi:hypothetical protein